LKSLNNFILEIVRTIGRTTDQRLRPYPATGARHEQDQDNHLAAILAAIFAPIFLLRLANRWSVAVAAARRTTLHDDTSRGPATRSIYTEWHI
jgi:hypothetical protein